ncbi:cold shock domain-containing protein [candidate division KSB1 bacterium]|nr:cold shock domain-containing protein [candidate division KSB1 bacterium]
MAIGIVKWFDLCKGYGYLTDEHGADVFFHYSEIQDQLKFKALQCGDRVEFSIQNDAMGPRAIHIKKLNSAN